MSIPVGFKCTTLLLLILLSTAKFSNHSCDLSSSCSTTTASSSLSTSQAAELVPPHYGILVVHFQKAGAADSSASPAEAGEEEEYFVVHYNQQEVPRLRSDLKFYPVIRLPDPHDICYDPSPDRQQFLGAVLVLRYETILRCNLSSQARDVEERGGRGLLVQLPRHVPIRDVQVGPRATIDPSFFIALISDKTTEAIFRKDHQQSHHRRSLLHRVGQDARLRDQSHSSSSSSDRSSDAGDGSASHNWSNESSVSVAIFAPHTLDATSLVPIDLKTVAVWVTAVITLLLGTYFSSGRKNQTYVKKKFPVRVPTTSTAAAADQMPRRRNQATRLRRYSSAGEATSSSHFADDLRDAADQQLQQEGLHEDKGPETEREACDQDHDDDGDEEGGDQVGRKTRSSDQENKSLIQILLLICWLAVLPFVLFIFFNFIAYFMVAVFAVASIAILYVCCDSRAQEGGGSGSAADAGTATSSRHHSRSGSCSSTCTRRGHHHHHHHHRRRRGDHEGDGGENEGSEQIASASTSSSC